MMRLITIVGAMFLLVSACGDDSTPQPEPNTEADPEEDFYLLTIVRGDGGRVELTADDVDTNWDPNSGFIFLNTDACNEPLGTLTMTVHLTENASGDLVGVVEAGLLSKSDVRVGTALETNAASWELDQPSGGDVALGALTPVVLGAGFIAADVEMTMEKVLVTPNDQPETVTVTGRFVALSGNGTRPNNGGDRPDCACALETIDEREASICVDPD